MKKGLLLGIAFFMGVFAAYGQTSAKVFQKAALRSGQMALEGWTVKIGSPELARQLGKLYTMQEELDNGQKKYIIAEGKGAGATYEAATGEATKVATQNLASLIGGEGSLEFENVIRPLICYREIQGGKIEVSLYLACTRENAVKAKLATVKQMLKQQHTSPKIETSHKL